MVTTKRQKGDQKMSNLEPVIQDVLHRHQFIFPFVHLDLERLNERRAFHCLGLDDVIVEKELYVVDSRQDRYALKQTRFSR